MLSALRSASQSWLAKFLLLLLVVSFGVWGVSSSMLSGPRATTVLEAGNSTVGVNEFRLAYDRQVRVLSQQLGQRLTAEQARAFGIDRQVVSQLANGLVLDEMANSLNLGLSEKKLATLTGQDEAFHNASGQFDELVFNSVLRNAGMRPEDYLQSRANVAKRQQIIEAAVDGMTAPDTFLEALSVHDAETRDVRFIVLGNAQVDPKPVPDDAAISAYFEANKGRYAFPEYRSFKYLRLTPEDVADQVPVSDEDIAADYERSIARFTTPEQRTIQQVVFPDRAAADAAAAKLASGATFDDILAERGVNATDATLGTLAKAAISDPAIAEAAFALAAGATSGVVDGTFGPVILRVTSVTPETRQTLDDVRETLRRELAINSAAETVLELHDAYEDARGSGTSFDDAARDMKVPVILVERIDASGQLAGGGAAPELPVSSELLAGVFQTDIGDDVPPLGIGATGFVWYEVTDVQPARDATLDEVRERVVADWTHEETSKALDVRAEALLGEIKAGKTLDEIAAQFALPVNEALRITRTGGDAVLGTAGTAAAFGGPDGHKAVAAGAGGEDRVLLAVTAVNRPGPDKGRLPAGAANGISAALTNDMFDQLVDRLQQDTPVSVNQNAMTQALSF